MGGRGVSWDMLLYVYVYRMSEKFTAKPKKV